MIEVEGLSKTFGRRNPITAFDDVSFSVEKGRVFGLLGPSDAGKTTILRILATVLKPTRGSAAIGGFDVVVQRKQAREILGFMAEIMDFGPWSTVMKYLNFWGGMTGVSGARRKGRIEEVVQYLEIQDAASEDPSELTVDRQKQLGLAQALISDPEVLILDEPMSGASIAGKDFMIRKLKEFRGQGKTIILSSPLLSEVQRVCDSIAIFADGRRTRVYDTGALLRQVGEGGHARIFLEAMDLPARVLSILKELDGILDIKSTATATIVYVDPERIQTSDVERVLEAEGVSGGEVREAEITLGDVFRAVSENGEA